MGILHLTNTKTYYTPSFAQYSIRRSKFHPRYLNQKFSSLLSCLSRREKNANLIADALEFMYTPWPDKSNKYALRGQLMDLFGDFVSIYLVTSPPIFTVRLLRYTYSSLRIVQKRLLSSRSGWAWSMVPIDITTLEFLYSHRFLPVTTQMTKTSVCSLWRCTQTLLSSVIQRHSQSAVLCGRDTTQATGRIYELTRNLRWRRPLPRVEWHSGMITIQSLNKSSLIRRNMWQVVPAKMYAAQHFFSPLFPLAFLGH